MKNLNLALKSPHYFIKIQKIVQTLLNLNIDDCLLKDQFIFKRRQKSLIQRLQKHLPSDIGIAKLVQDVTKSQAITAQRKANIKDIHYPSELPVSGKIEEISQLIKDHQLIILCGETGSGKSTQLPKICLSLGYGIKGRIAHTQPRRIAARSLANRISDELKSETGKITGYKVRFKDQVSAQTSIKLLTDGMLLAEIQQDRYLNEYDCIIIDEAHERSLNIDFLLGYLKQLMPKRPDLKIIITSATINPQQFSEFYHQAPVINVSGRTFPVDVHYQPIDEDDSDNNDQSAQLIAIEGAIQHLSQIGRGDILVFLSGEREIRETVDFLTKKHFSNTEILPLFARLSPAEQGKIFKSSGLRRIILATNVAETSLTIPNIRYVIDTGFARISRYSYRSKIQRLPIERISQAAANQRKGRCGRVSKGICVRLYEEESFNQRAEFTEAEIQRTNLASVILKMQILGFGDIANFPFIDPPDHRLIKDGYQVLSEISAVDGLKKVTRLGQQIARLPVDPKIGRMLLEATKQGCLQEVTVIAAALSVQDPKDRPFDKQAMADQAHQVFRHQDSDFLTYWNLWQAVQKEKKNLTRRKFTRWCRASFLSPSRLQEWIDIHYQLKSQMLAMDYKENENKAADDVIHQSLLSGLVSQIGFKSKEHDYSGTRNSKFWLFPASVLFKAKPKWVMTAELVETTKLYARTNAKIDSRWIETAASHLLKHTYAAPHWEKKRGQVTGKEQLTLYGLTVVPWRKVNYGRIYPEESREIFIRFALVEQDFHSRAPFWRHNQQLIQSLRDQEAKARKADLFVDEELIYDYYQQRIPEGIYSAASFETWLRKATKTEPKILHMRMQDLVKKDTPEISEEDYPNQLKLGNISVPLKYCFEPSQKNDGINCDIPLPLINQINEHRGEWLVPALLRERVIQLIKGLPKRLRKSFVPVPQYADKAIALMEPSDTPLNQILAQTLKKMTGVHIAEEDWNEQQLSDHLKLNYRILDEKGKILDCSRDLNALRQKYADKAVQSFQQLPTWKQEQNEVKAWDFGDLPDHVDIKQGTMHLKGYPALVVEGKKVALKCLDSAEKAAQSHRQGLIQLVMNQHAKDIRYLRKSLPNLTQMRLQYSKVPNPQKIPTLDIEKALILLIIDHCFFQQGYPRQQAVYQQTIDKNLNQLMLIADKICKQISIILNEYQKVRKQLSHINAINCLPSLQDIQQQLEELIYHGFLSDIEWQNLSQYPRYLKAIQLRLDKLKQNPSRDQEQMRLMQSIYQDWQHRQQQLKKKGQRDPRIEEIHWWLEELRVSFFAQSLKTAFPVSIKRLEKHWKSLGL